MLRVGVGAVVLRGRSILLVKRRYPPSKGYWSIPGGHLREGESVYDAALRELAEETGLRGRPLCVSCVDELLVYGSQSGKLKTHYVLVDVAVEVDEGYAPRPGSDALEARFMDIDKALARKDVTLSTVSYLIRLVDKGGLENPCGGIVPSSRTVVVE